MKHTFFTLLFCISFVSFSQNSGIKGQCIDKLGQAIENVKIGVPLSDIPIVYSDSKGQFLLPIPENITGEIEILFRFEKYDLRKKVNIKTNEWIELNQITFSFQNLQSVEVQGKADDPITPIHLEKLDLVLLPLSSVERALIFTTAATSNNELSSNYNVRGGNYDENLVYVNGFLINRPFLTRTGQQEGLSFIHTALVDNIQFSAGGFESKYGDKLSSVLDIKYKVPDSLIASITASLLGAEITIGDALSPRVNYIVGARYRNNGYFLKSLPTKGSYNPIFYDAQSIFRFHLKDNLIFSTLFHFSGNEYRFQPESQETEFGTVNEAYRLNIYFDGRERTRFYTSTAGTSLQWNTSKRNSITWLNSYFHSNEAEKYDIQGQYYINLLEKDPAKEEFGDSIATLGVGTFLNHARNKLLADLFVTQLQGEFQKNEKQQFQWGISFQKENFNDQLSEWKMIDSAGYSLPQNEDQEIDLYESIKGKLHLNNSKYNAFLQWNTTFSKDKTNFPVKVKYIDSEKGKKIKKSVFDTIEHSYRRILLSYGLRTGLNQINEEFFITPRVNLLFYPRSYFYNDKKIKRRNLVYKLSTGLYYQPPLYREYRTFDGKLNTDVTAQKSFHLVAGNEFLFTMWNRKVPFKFSSEVYYKYLWDVNPYEVDNVRTRYYAQNNAVAYAYGLDLNLHGEFVDGIESYFKMGFLSTKENLKDDQYTVYYNQAGEQIYFGYSEDQEVVDSAIVYPKYIPRPTDQMVNFAILFQDNMPGNENITVQLALFFGSRLPYGPPDFERYKDTLRQKSYFRTDVGFSYDFISKSKIKNSKKRKLQDAILSLEVFNLMGIRNVLSMQWVQDVGGKYYAVPNYLTQRRINLKLVLRY
ncbi:MAG: TonB-dependent receptor plug domain-containing protein [Flavobacteriia bacterium]|nr:TonB-dependent receptor plug domain-containing protein [Flavobacteriia bacterium]